MIPNPEDWYTPRYWYANTNMLAPLPADLDNSGRTDTLLPLRLGDDVMTEGEASLSLRLLLSDPNAAGLPGSERLPAVEIATIGHAGGLMNEPPAAGIGERIEVRLNNCLLGRCEAVERLAGLSRRTAAGSRGGEPCRGPPRQEVRSRWSRCGSRSSSSWCVTQGRGEIEAAIVLGASDIIMLLKHDVSAT